MLYNIWPKLNLVQDKWSFHIFWHSLLCVVCA